MTDGRRTLGDVAHTPPNEERNPVQRRYQRGPDAVADGSGRPEMSEETTDRTMKEVSHTPPHGEGASGVFGRGRVRDDDE